MYTKITKKPVLGEILEACMESHNKIDRYVVFVASNKEKIIGHLPKRKSAKYAKTAAQKMKFSIKDFFSKCDQIRSFQLIWSNLLKKTLMENFIFCAVNYILLFMN